MSDDPHAHWEKMVSAAYLRIMGATQKEAASAVGRAERTIRLWESDERWREAREEAADRWLGDLTDASRRTILATVRKGDGSLALTVLERVDDRLAPPKHRVDISGEIDFGVMRVPTEADSDVGWSKSAREHQNRLAALSRGNAKPSGNGTGA